MSDRHHHDSVTLKNSSDKSDVDQKSSPSTVATNEFSTNCVMIKSDLTARIISGSIGSLITSLLVTPLEVVKIRMQASAGEANVNTISSLTPPSKVGSSSGGKVNVSKTSMRTCPRGCGTFILYNGHMDCVLSKSWVSYFDPSTGKLKSQVSTAGKSASINAEVNLGIFGMIRRIFAEEGLKGIYAGLRPTLVMAVPNTVLYFSAYDEIVYRLRRYNLKITDNCVDVNSFTNTMIPLFAGASARLVSSTVTAPFELLRTLQAAESGVGVSPSRGIWQEFKYITQNEGGIWNLYRGLKPTLYRDVPFSAIYWVLIEQFRTMWKTNETSTPTPYMQAIQAFLNGAAAGMISAACTTPFDVIKTRQQANSLEQFVIQTTTPSAMNLAGYQPNTGLSIPVTSVNQTASVQQIESSTLNTWSYLRHIAQNEGITALWRGNQARMLKVAPSCAIMISSYEFGKRLLEPELKAM